MEIKKVVTYKIAIILQLWQKGTLVWITFIVHLSEGLQSEFSPDSRTGGRGLMSRADSFCSLFRRQVLTSLRGFLGLPLRTVLSLLSAINRPFYVKGHFSEHFELCGMC